MYITGSIEEAPLAALLFFEDGTMKVACSGDGEDHASIMLVTDFFSYALSRDDWMENYVRMIKKDRNDIKKSTRNQFKVIQGGVTGSVKY